MIEPTTATHALSPALFLDRDGTLIEDWGYLADPDQVRLLPGVIPALAALQQHGWKLVLVSNQSGVGRGYFSAQQMQAVHQRFAQLLQNEGIQLLDSYYCPHAPAAACDCRKPAPGLLLRAAAEHHIDLAASYMIGDKLSDVQAGLTAGCCSIWLHGDDLPVSEEFRAAAVFPNFSRAAAWILAQPEPIDAG